MLFFLFLQYEQLKNLHYYLKQLKFPTQKNKKAEI